MEPVIDVGTPMEWSEPASAILNFHEFEGLDSTKDVKIESPPFQLHGKEWSIHLYPGGEMKAKDGFVGCYLKYKGETSTPIPTRYSLSGSKMNKRAKGLQNDFDHGSSYGEPNFMERSKLINEGLDDGSLTLRVTIRIRIPKLKVRSIPKQDELYPDMMRLLRSGKSADVGFDFGNGESLNAHSQILLARAPLLAELVQEEGHTTVAIQHTPCKTFKRFLEFLYTGNATLGDSMPEAKQMLQVANRFGVIKLKLIMESHLINKHLAYESAIDLLILADSCSCAFMREEAMTVAAKHVKKLMRSDDQSLMNDWSLLKRNADLFTETMEHSHGKPKRDDELAHLSVGQIYEELYGLGATAIDGTRKMLVQKLLGLREEQNSQDESAED